MKKKRTLCDAGCLLLVILLLLSCLLPCVEIPLNAAQFRTAEILRYDHAGAGVQPRTAAGTASAEKTVTAQKPSKTILLYEFEGKETDISEYVRFIDEAQEVPYLDVRILEQMFPEDGYKTEQGKDGTYQVKRPLDFWNSAVMLVSPASNQVEISLYDYFLPSEPKLSTGESNENLFPYLQTIQSGSSSLKELENVRIDLGKYGLSVIESDGNVFLPYTLFAGVLLDPVMWELVYTGDEFLLSNDLQLLRDTGTDAAYNAFVERMRSGSYSKETEHSRAVADMNYAGLCLRLDYVYSFKNWKFPDGIDALLSQSYPEIREMLTSTDGSRYYAGLYDLVYRVLSNMHTSIMQMPRPAYVDGSLDQINTLLSGIASAYPEFMEDRNSFLDAMNQYETSRMNSLGPAEIDGEGMLEGLRFYKDVAVITIDTESYDSNFWSNYKKGDAITTNDTIGLLYQSFDAIKKHSPKIKKVVVDLSNNTGGYMYVGCALLGFMKHHVTLRYYYPTTKLMATATIAVDTNCDGKITSSDSYEGKYQFYIMTSPVSFSAGNSIPAMAREQGIATLIGQKSGGGSGNALTGMDSFGSQFNYSGNSISTTLDANGEVLNLDDGVEPDVSVAMEDMYNYGSLYKILWKQDDTALFKSVALKKASLSLKKGKKYTISFKKKFDRTSASSISYKTSKKTIATVSQSGVVLAKKKGSATITVTIKGKSGKKKTLKMRVNVTKK